MSQPNAQTATVVGFPEPAKRLEQARKLASYGFSLIPVNGKVPAVKWEQFQSTKATDDNHVAWFGGTAARNIGIVCGAVSGIVVVDTDSEDAESWAAANLPPTPMMCQTGGGGRHRYYRHPGRSVPNRARIRTGAGELALDVRGDGGYVVAPGSVHPNGTTYRAPSVWPSDLSGLPMFDPAWLGDASVPKRIQPETETSQDQIPNGRRNAELTSLAGSMRRKGMSGPAIAAALKVENAARCSPPLPDTEVDAIAESVSRYQPEPRRSVIHLHRRLELLDDAALMSRPDPRYLIQGHVIENTLVTGYGPPSSFKSFIFTIDMALSIATGKPWLGHDVVTPGAAVAVVAEGAAALKQRVKSWKVARGLPLDVPIGFHTLPQAVQLSEPDDVEQLIDVIGPLTPRVVVIDTLPRCLGSLEENSNTEMGRAVQAMDRIREATGAVVLPITHTDKAEKDIRGAGALRGACDTVFRVSRTDDVCSISCDKQKDGDEPPEMHVKVVAVPGTDSVVVRLASDVLPGDRLTVQQFKVWSTLSELVGTKGATSTELEKLCPDIKPRTLYRILNRLTELSAVYQEASGKRYFAKPLAPSMWPE